MLICNCPATGRPPLARPPNPEYDAQATAAGAEYADENHHGKRIWHGHLI